MIFGDIHTISETQMSTLHPIFKRVVNYLSDKDLTKFNLDEEHCIQEGVFFSVVERDTKPLENCRLEAHREYVDIHFLISGQERIGVSFDKGQFHINEDMRPARDTIFFDSESVPSDNLFTLNPGNFLIVFPEEVHRALYQIESPQSVRKTVIKVATRLL